VQGLDLNGPGLRNDPNWYRKAVFYEVLVRAFADSNGSGSGDFNGLMSKLDYLEWLGVDCLWIPPFYASPLKDGGYDISDYCAVLPEFGTLPDFCELVNQAHARGIRVVTDLAINHTSDQHPWFQASRTDPEGPYGDFYVWSDSPDRYSDARIIFVDTETSNWTFDPVRRQYYWHRFFSHQPDLNYEIPAVQDAVMDVIRFWMDLGIDGMRLDAIPYLFEEEGSSCENLPRTHEYIRRIRRMIDSDYPGRILLAEANQWPKDVVEYFGTESEPECHMAFHFPVMPRIYYALREERSAPIVDIMRETPEIPQGAQWGTFLRNHDELTLEMVTTEERAAMYGWYAPDARMRANIGIRRRLTPLLDNSRDEIELVKALLFSLPGSPYLYYGDEIGMGDNIWLQDRDALRTPMQWTPDRNAGFSTADPGKLYLPVVQSLVHHHSAVNVEAQLSSSSSLLNWVRAMLAVRKRHSVFGLGAFVPLESQNPHVLAFLRVLGDDVPGEEPETVLCVNNLAASPQGTCLRMPEHAGAALTDLFGGGGFPPVQRDGALTMTLGSRGFFWLQVTGGTPLGEVADS
jgi:maltose alpha-D-glucosyltransferase / alpha-amylase